MSKMRSWTTEQLVEALQAPDEDTGYAAAEELGRRRDKIGLKAIVTVRWAGDSDEETPQVTAQQLHLQDEISKLPYQTSEALLETIVRLAPYLHNRRLAMCGLKGLGETGVTSLIRFVEPTFKDITFLMCVLADTRDERVIELLYEMLHKHPTLCLIAFGRMGQLGMQIVRQRLLYGDFPLRSAIVSDITHLNNWEQQPAFLEALLTLLEDESSYIVILAIRRLGETKLPSLIPHLTPFLRRYSFPNEAVKALRNIGTPEALAAVEAWEQRPK